MANELTGILWSIEKADRTDRKVQNLACRITVDMLKAIHREMDKNKAYGVDKVTKEEYDKRLDENLEDLIARMKAGSYKPQPSRRV